MRAAIDIGSNSIRLAFEDGTVHSQITKLADGLNATGALSAAGVERTVEALKSYADMCKGHDATAFATEAVRAASDGIDFCQRVKRETGLTVRILTGEEEAVCALRGAYKPAGAVTVCDLGGGSMELVSSPDGETPDYVKSLPLGVVALKNRFNGDIRAAIDGAPELVAGYGSVPARPLVICGGSACCIAAGLAKMQIYDKNKINGACITAHELDDAMPMLTSKDLAVFRPVCAKRADTVPFGAIIIRALLAHINADRFYVSDSGNLSYFLSPDFSL